MQAVIIAGGEGTRLRPFTSVLPKPLVPIGDISIVELVLEQLASFGFTDVVVSVGYKAELIMAVLADGSKYGLNIRYCRETVALGTMGPLSIVEDLDDDFLVINADVCSNLDYGLLFKEHKKQQAIATVATFRKRQQVEFGTMELDDGDSRVVSFREKPVHDYFVAMGVYVFKRAITDWIPSNINFGFDDLISALLDKGERIFPYVFDGKWLDVGRPDDYQRMVDEFGANPTDFLRG